MSYRTKFWGLLLSSLIICQSAQSIYSQTVTPNNQGISNPVVSSNSTEQRVLELNKPIERELKGGESHTYTLELKANEFSKIVVEQKGIDVVVNLFSPSGELLREVDGTIGEENKDILSLIAKEPSVFKIEIKPLDVNAVLGKYAIETQTLRTALAEDNELVDIEILDSKFILLRGQNKFDEAAFCGEKALELRKNVLGIKHLQTTVNLTLLGELYFAKGDYDKAEGAFKKVLEIREELLGKEHIGVAEALSNLAYVYYIKTDYKKAEPLFDKAISIYQKFPELETSLATVLSGLGHVYFQQGNYEKAEICYNDSSKIEEKILGSQHPQIARSFSNLGLLYLTKTEYEKAEIFFEKAIAIYEKNFGLEFIDSAVVWQNLGELHHIKGDYKNAEFAYEKALFLREKVLGVEHTETANSFKSLALLYKDYGDYEKAENLYKRSLAIYEKVLGPENLHVIVTLKILGELYYLQKNYSEAELLFKQALGLYEKNFGQENYLMAEILSNLALIYATQKKHDEAEKSYKKALLMSEKVLGVEHSITNIIANNLACFYRNENQYEQAKQLFERAIMSHEKLFGQNHPALVMFNSNLSELYQAKEDFDKAIKCKTISNSIRESNLEKILYSSSEDQKLKYLSSIKAEMYQSLSLHLRLAPTNEQACKMALTDLLRRKGRSLDSLTNSFALLKNRASLEDKILLDDLSQTQTQLARISLKGAGKEGTEAYFAKVKALEEKAEKLQKQISNKSAEFSASIAKVNLEEVQKSIPSDAVLVEIAIYMPYDLKTRTYEPPRYIAYILEAQGNPKFVELGDAEIIDQAVLEFREALVKYPGQPLSNINRQLKPKARAIDKLVMEPVRKLLGDKMHLLVAPDGGLNIVPFDAFVDEKGKYLIENYEITYLTSGRDLIRLQTKTSTKEPSIVVADPDYGEGKGPVLANRQYEPLSKLEATLQEALQIKKLFPESYVYLGNKATEENIKSIKRPEILHLATHGLFLPDNPIKTKVVSSDGEQRILVVSRQDGKEVTRNITSQELKLSNPLLRSCLFFAGANQTKQEENQSDGVMTALEVSSLDLFGTKLVVLSACESGLGKIQTGEGVYGLRRALVLAGAETQMISLWAVSDDATKDLMTNYYKALKSGESRGKALRQAQLSFLQTNTSLTARKAQTRLRQSQTSDSNYQTKQKNTNSNLAHPYYWASFIQSGEWGTLEGKR